MSEMFSTRHAQIYFRVASPQTIRNWTKEFSGYLSPTATPGTGNTRRLTAEDMSVLALIAQMSNEGRSFEDIHLALAAGQRGDMPNITSEEIDVLMEGEIERQLSEQIKDTRQTLEQLKDELSLAKAQIQPLHDENIRLKAQVESKDERITDLNEQIRKAQQRIEELSKQVGESYYRGLIEGLKPKGDLPKSE
jgi:DNA-binding transcriptional MerR regulator